MLQGMTMKVETAALTAQQGEFNLALLD